MSFCGVKTRHVFFVSGFDPKPAAHYHALYRDQAALQSRVNGMDVHVSSRTRNDRGGSCWTVSCVEGGQTCNTLYEYVRWDDIVRKHWPRGAWGMGRDVLSGLFAVLFSGQLSRVWGHARRPLLAMAYAFGFLASGLLLCGLSAFVGAALTRLLGGADWLAWSVALGAGFFSFRLFARLERRLNMVWMGRILNFSRVWANGRVPELDERLDAMAQAVRDARADPAVDEVLIVGISVGSQLAVALTARSLQRHESDAGMSAGAALSLLTLGHCIPLLGLMRSAATFRAELASVAAHPSVQWVDFSAPNDWVSFGPVDPVSMCGLSVHDRPNAQPVMLSPRFHTLFSPANYRRLARDKFRLHRQYIMASELAGAYDYFSITAGALRLLERFPVHPQ
jgi:hypothetical protein